MAKTKKKTQKSNQFVRAIASIVATTRVAEYIVGELGRRTLDPIKKLASEIAGKASKRYESGRKTV